MEESFHHAKGCRCDELPLRLIKRDIPRWWQRALERALRDSFPLERIVFAAVSPGKISDPSQKARSVLPEGANPFSSSEREEGGQRGGEVRCAGRWSSGRGCLCLEADQESLAGGFSLLLLYLKEYRPARERREVEVMLARLLREEEAPPLLVGVENPSGWEGRERAESCPSRILRRILEEKAVSSPTPVPRIRSRP